MEGLREYETFQSVSEMDSFISEALFCYDFSDLERRLLRLLAAHSCKFVGVSFLKVSTMAEALEVSSKTVQRALRKLKELGIINRVRTIRPSRGGFGASITQLCPVDLSYRNNEENPREASSKEPSQKKETFSFKAFFKDIKYIRQESKLDYSFLNEFVPQDFIEVVEPFVDAEEAYSLWGKVQGAAKRYAPDVMDLTEPAIRAFRASVLAYKTKKIKKSFGAYFWGSLSGLLTVEQRRICGVELWNWLE